MKAICTFAVLSCALSLATATTAETPKEVKASLLGAGGNNVGTVTFKAEKDGVKMSVHLAGLPEGEHALHIDEHAVCDAPDFKTAGDHFNPTNKQHGYENALGHPAGDTPVNITVFPDGEGEGTFLIKDISMDPSAANSILANGGTSVVIHEHGEDMKTDPSGNSGSRIACGVVKP
jgi:Cu-Zn family superoxide dismutase